MQSPQTAGVFSQLDELEQVYLIARAYDLFLWGEQIANVTFPQPRLHGANAIITALVREIEELVQERPSHPEHHRSSEQEGGTR